MKLKDIINGMDVLETDAGPETEVSSISYDSRTVKPGGLFVAMRGLVLDGHDFIPDALRRGASVIVAEKGGTAPRVNRGTAPGDKGGTAPLIRVSDSRDALAFVSNNFYGRPSQRMSVIGVTGTNGKTTTASLIKAVLDGSGKKTGLTGTISYQIGERSYPAPHTTPEALEYQCLLSEMLNAGCTHAVSEVSSHALSLKRVDHTRFRAAVFTNLTRDHLDFHKTMESYFEAKKRLFAELLDEDGTAAINIDDPYGVRLLPHVRGRVMTYSAGSAANVTANDIIMDPDGVLFVLRHGKDSFRIESPLIGVHNVYNILASLTAAFALGVGWEEAARTIKGTGHVRGRFEKVDAGQGFLCVIDYAHTEDALRRLIEAAKGITKGRIITVFGCGGSRDRGKRPLMGKAATELSDFVFITSDNPRGEDPLEIIKEIEAGCGKKNYRSVPERKEAIYEAVSEARDGDAVLIAGKGHEEYQEVAGMRFPFSDREAALEALRERLG